MSNILTAGRQALIVRLGSITPANGYRTRIGTNVRYGWLSALLQEADQTLPLTVVQKARDRPPTSKGMDLRALRGYRIVVALEPDADEEAIDDAELDLIECLMPTEGIPLDWTPQGITQITLGEPDRFPPGDGLPAATLLLPIYLHTFVQGRPH